MARGGRPGKKRTQYVRDAQGQFASTPGGGKKATPSAVRKAAKAAALKGGTLAARSSLKRSRAKLAGIDKADQTLQTSLSKRAQKGAVTRGKKKLSQAIKSSQAKLNVAPKLNTIKKKRSPIIEAKPLQKPASQRPGSMTSTLRGALKSLAQADAQRIREIESITGQKLKPIKERAAAVGDRIRSAAKGGKVASTLKAGLRELAQSDARTMRGMAEIVRDATPKVSGGKSGKALKGAKKALPAAKPTEPSPSRAKAATSSSGTINWTRADTATAYKKRIRPARAAAARMAPADKPVSVSRSDGNLIVGKTWEQIQAAQKGAKRALNGGPITGKSQKPKATQGDRRLLAQKGMKGLKAEGMYGVLDRLKNSKVRIGGKAKSSIGIRKPPPVAPAPKPPTRIKGSRTTLPRTPGTVAKAKRGKVRPDANPKPAVLPITSERRKPLKLKGIGAAIKGNLRGWTGLPVEIRSRKRSAAAQRYRSNELGKKVAASIGFNQAVSQRKTFAESSKRIVFKRGNMRQFNLFGGIQKVGGGRFKPVGERMASGRVYQPKYTRPLANSKTRKKEIERLINNNNGKAVAAFYL